MLLLCLWYTDSGGRAVILKPLECFERGVRIPPREWMFVLVFVVCFVGSGLCDGLIIHSEERYRCLVSNCV